MYDDHGGLCDHVPPPTTVNPDDKKWVNDGISLDPSFDFTRLGVRVPAILISPYIPAGRIDHTVYDHTSVIATARKLLISNVANAHLTLRDKLANTFEGNLTLQQPHTDTVDLGAVAASQPPSAAQLAMRPNDHLAADVMQAAFFEKQMRPACQQSGRDPATISTEITTEAAASAYLQVVHAKIRALSSTQIAKSLRRRGRIE